MKKVKLNRKNSSGDISFQLPPAPARIRLYVSNQLTGTGVKQFDVWITVPGRRSASKVGTLFSPEFADREILAPSDKGFTLRIKAEGFRDLSERVNGSAMPKLDAGAEESLNVQLEPRKARSR